MRTSIDEDDEFVEEEEVKFKDPDAELTNELENRYGFKKIFYLPYQDVWSYNLRLLAGVSILICIYETAFRQDTEEPFYMLKLAVTILYLIDIMLRIGSKNMRGVTIPPNVILFPNWILVFDCLSLIPLNVAVSNHSHESVLLYRVLQLNDILKGARIEYFMYIEQNLVGNNKMLLAGRIFYAHMLLGTTISISLSYATLYQGGPISSNELSSLIYDTIGKMTGAYYTRVPFEYYFVVTTASFYLLFYLSVIFQLLASFSIILVTIYEPRYAFFKKLKVLNVSKGRLPQDLIKRILKYYDVAWKRQSGHSDNISKQKTLPLACYQEIAMDIHWFALKHSSVFRSASLPFLRHISLLFKNKILLAGDVVFANRAVKNRMIYLVSGIMQIVSIEDGETPILSFSGGTCLGDLSLFFHYKSQVSVRCKTICSLYVLKRKDFTEDAIKYFPDQYREIRKNLLKRIEAARLYHKMAVQFNCDKGQKKGDIITIMWLKSTLHKLMMKDKATSSKHQCQNLFLRSEFDEDKFKDKIFVGDYLDTLVITERLQLVTDTIFLKSYCPCILQPSSVVLNVWYNIIYCLAIIVAIVVPFYAFVEATTPLGYIVFIYVITFFWMLDVYVQISTSVKTSNEFISNIGDIFFYRLSTMDFLLDLIAATPLELFSCVLLEKVTTQTRILLHMNRIVKVFRFKGKFLKIGVAANDFPLINYLKLAIITMYSIYFCACLMFALNCYDSVCIETPVDMFDDFMDRVIVMGQLFMKAGIKHHYSGNELYYPFFSWLSIFILFFYIIVYGYLLSLHILQRLHRLLVDEKLQSILKILYNYKLKDRFEQRLLNYTLVQWCEDSAMKYLYGQSILRDLPIHIYRELKEGNYREIIVRIPAFKTFPPEFISDLCVVAKMTIIPENEYICYERDIPDTFYIIFDGYCQVMDNMSSIRKTVIGPSETISLIETLMNIPVLNSMHTITDCKMLAVKKWELKELCLKHPSQGRMFNDIVRILKPSFKKHIEQRTEVPRILKDDYQNKKSFRKFGYNIRLGTKEEYDYYTPFDQLQSFSFIQYFLLRYTILPNGKFILIWEIIRCCCAVLSAIAFTDNIMGTCVDCWFFNLTVLLDSMAWIDLYLRLHVAYYNQKNLLVTHPLKTVTHYLTHDFVIDLIGVFPIGSLVPNQSNRVITFLQCNRVIQMHRFLGFFKYFEINNFEHGYLYLILIKMFIIGIVSSCVLGMLLVNSLCEINENIKADPSGIFEAGITCNNNSWIVQSNFVRPLNYARIRLYSILLSTCITSICGIDGFKLASYIPLLIITILICSFILACITGCSVISNLISIQTTFVNYQSALYCVKEYMKATNVRTDLQVQLINHFELKWARKKGRRMHELISTFHDTLRQDILYDLYGMFLESVSVFGPDCKLFIRKLILYISHDVAIKDSYVCVVNDIKDDLHIIFKGSAFVIAPGGLKIATLGPGSMFGALDNSIFCRQTIGVIANGHMEILTIKTSIFYSTLKDYEMVFKNFKQLTSTHVDYLPGKGHVTIHHDSQSNSQNSITADSTSSMAWFVKRTIFSPHTRFIKIWDIIHLFSVCYIEVMFTLYQIVIREFYFPIIIIQYICDLMNILNFVISSRTAYDNEFGVLIIDSHLIWKHFYSNKIDFYLQLAAAIPLDIFVWFLPTFSYTLHAILRVNRLIRFYLFIKYFRNLQKTLNIHLVYIKFAYIVLLVIFILHCCTCAFLKLCCSIENNTNPKVICKYSDDFYKKAELFLMLHSFNIMFFITSHESYVSPNDVIIIIYFIFLIQCMGLFRMYIIALLYDNLYASFNVQITYERLVRNLQFYTQQLNVSPYLREKTIEFYKLLWKYHRGVPFPSLLLEAPTHMREEILNSAFAPCINRHYVFEKCHMDFNRQIVSYLRNETYYPDSYVVFQGSVNHCMYFVYSGAIACTRSDEFLRETVTSYLKSGCYFGVLPGLNSKEGHSYNYRAVTTSVVLTLGFDNWRHLLKFYPASAAIIKERLETAEDVYEV